MICFITELCLENATTESRQGGSNKGETGEFLENQDF